MQRRLFLRSARAHYTALTLVFPTSVGMNRQRKQSK